MSKRTKSENQTYLFLPFFLLASRGVSGGEGRSGRKGKEMALLEYQERKRLYRPV